MEKIIKTARKKEAVYFCIVLLITKCMRAEIKVDEKLLTDLEWPYCTVTALARASVYIVHYVLFSLLILWPLMSINFGYKKKKHCQTKP